MLDDILIITSGVEGAGKAKMPSAPELSHADIIQSFLEKYFNVKLSASSAPDGAIEFYTSDGKLFTRVDSNGVVSVETSDSSYSFSAEEILEAERDKCTDEKDVCEDASGSESKGRKVVVNGEYVGVEDDGEYPQSIPADVAVDIYTEEEIVELERDSGQSLRRAAMRYAESAPSDEIRSEASSTRETQSGVRDRPREADTDSPHDEVSVSTREPGEGAVSSPEGVSQEGVGDSGGVEQLAPAGVNSAPYTPVNVAVGADANLGTAQIVSALAFAQRVEIPTNHGTEKGVFVAERCTLDGVQLWDVAQFFTGAARFVEVRNFTPVPESIPISNPRARPDVALAPVAEAAKSDSVPIRATAGVSIESRDDNRRTPVTVARVNANSRLDGEKVRQQGLAESAAPIEGDPVAIAWAQSDKGGGMPPAVSRTGIAYGEIETRPRLDVRPAHTKRDQGDGHGRNDRDRDERYPSDEDEEVLYS